jgi:hypothetical protein
MQGFISVKPDSTGRDIQGLKFRAQIKKVRKILLPEY